MKLVNFMKDKDDRIVAVDYGGYSFLPPSFFALALRHGAFAHELAAMLQYPPCKDNSKALVSASCALAPFSSNNIGEHIFSLSENTANKLLKQGMMDLIKHNKTHLVRTYPKGLRIGSTNYEPHRYWSAGCQLVSLNWQTFGRLRMYLVQGARGLSVLCYTCRPWLHDQPRDVPA